MSPPRQAPSSPTLIRAETLPPGLVSVPMGENCILLLSEAEYVRAIKRGRAWRRRGALRRRTRDER